MSEPWALVLRREEVMEETAKLVVVAEVVVLFCAVKFWRVVEPTTNRSPEELMVEVAMPPILRELPVDRLVKKLVVVAEVPVALVKVISVNPKVVPVRLVNVALVEKRLVVVALVPVALMKVRMEKSPVPETEPLKAALMKVPPSVRLEIFIELRPVSLSD